MHFNKSTRPNVKAATFLLGLYTFVCMTGFVCADASPSFDKPAIEEAIRKALPNTNITSVEATPIDGLVEVVAGNNVLYADPTGRYLLVGNLYDMHIATDLTTARKARLHAIQWSSLPMDTVIKLSKPGAPKMAVFYDPDCPWCRKLHQQLSEQQEIEVYTVLYPVEGLHPEAKRKSAEILCAPNPREALNRMTEGKSLSSKPTQACMDKALESLEGVVTFARDNGIQGTPTLIAEDGRVRAGFMPFDQIKSWLLSPNAGATDKRGTQ